MSSRTNGYHFVDRWRLKATDREVSDILMDVASWTRWWPSTYLSIEETSSGDESGLGGAGAVHAKGWLPYTLRFNYLVTRSDPPHGFNIDAQGDLTGKGSWLIVQDGEWVDATFTWTILPSKAVIRYLSFIFRPIFRSNHNWTMRMGERSMQLEIERRRAANDDKRARIPPPPGPISNVPWALGFLLTIVLGGLLWRSRR